jgi:hypothetical protein
VLRLTPSMMPLVCLMMRMCKLGGSIPVLGTP